MSKHSKLAAELSALPDAKGRHRKWTLEEDACILKFVETKGISAVARTIGTMEISVKKRYALLKQKIKGKK